MTPTTRKRGRCGAAKGFRVFLGCHIIVTVHGNALLLQMSGLAGILCSRHCSSPFVQILVYLAIVTVERKITLRLMISRRVRNGLRQTMHFRGEACGVLMSFRKNLTEIINFYLEQNIRDEFFKEQFYIHSLNRNQWNFTDFSAILITILINEICTVFQW